MTKQKANFILTLKMLCVKKCEDLRIEKYLMFPEKYLEVSDNIFSSLDKNLKNIQNL